LDLAGAVRLGWDVRRVEDLDTGTDERFASDFRDGAARYRPGARERELLPSYSGIRPKVSGPGRDSSDFVIQTEREHGVEGLVNLFGIESPGLTSSLAIADLVATSI
jgi:L-2-hydroxyglutarate oxidase LhgO